MSYFFKSRSANITNRANGFSIIELVVYISIMTLMLGVIMGITISTVRSHRAIKAAKSIENSAIVTLERITREVRKSNSISLASSIFDSTPGKLVLNSIDEDSNAHTAEFYLASNAIYLKEDGVDLGALTQSDTKVNSLIFRRFSGTNVEGVRVELSLESGTSTYYKSGTFYTSSILR